MIEYLFKTFEKKEEPKSELKPMKVRSYYPDNYPINGTSDEKFQYYVKNTEIVPLTK